MDIDQFGELWARTFSQNESLTDLGSGEIAPGCRDIPSGCGEIPPGCERLLRLLLSSTARVWDLEIAMVAGLKIVNLSLGEWS